MTSKAICFVCSMTCSNPNLGKPIVSISGRVTNHLHPLRKTPNGSKSLAPHGWPGCPPTFSALFFVESRHVRSPTKNSKAILQPKKAPGTGSWRSIPSEHQWMCQTGDEKKSVAYEGLMGFEGKLIISPDSSLKEVRRTYKRGSYDEKWNIILTNPQSTTVISRSSSGRHHSSNVFCCPNGKIMAAKLAPAESAWSKHHEWSEEIKVDVLRTVQQCLRYF